MNRWLKSLQFAVALLALIAGPLSAQAQGYPNRPVKIIVPFLPGGGNDVLARILGGHLTQRWKQPVLVENKAGAAGNIATEFVARAPADGYTLLSQANTMAMVPWLYPKLSFDVQKDFVPVLYIANTAFVLVTTPSLPVGTTQELISYAKANPGKLTYATTGHGGPQHLAAELFDSMAGTEMTHIPYKGAVPGWTALMTGEVSLTFGAFNSAFNLIKAGKVKAIAAASARRLPALPDLPTLREAGLTDYEAGAWYALFAPAGTPPEIVSRFYEESVKILQTPEIRDPLNAQGFEIVAGSPKMLGDTLAKDLDRWGKLIKARNIRPQQ